MKLLCEDGASAQALRRKLGLSQSVFWGRVGVVQSGGSHYESGRQLPIQLAWALHIVYGTEAQASAMVKSLRCAK